MTTTQKTSKNLRKPEVAKPPVQTAADKGHLALQPSVNGAAVIEAYQAAAWESMLWFENAGDYMHLEPMELAYLLMTRSGTIDRERLRRRDPQFVAEYERNFVQPQSSRLD